MKKKPLCNCKTRRDFLKTCSSFILSLACLHLTSPFLMSCSKYNEEDIVNAAVSSAETGITYDSSSSTLSIPFVSDQGVSLQSSGGFITIDTVDSYDVYMMLANINGSVVAYSSICPHARVFNQWSFTNNQFICGSHNSIFTSTGIFSTDSSTSNVSNLEQFNVTTTDSVYLIQTS